MPEVRSIRRNSSFITIISLLTETTSGKKKCNVNLHFVKLDCKIFETCIASIKARNDRLLKPYSIIYVIRGKDLYNSNYTGWTWSQFFLKETQVKLQEALNWHWCSFSLSNCMITMAYWTLADSTLCHSLIHWCISAATS